MADILVVEDDRAFFELVADFLEDSGHRAACAESADEFLAAVDARSPQLVIMDMQFPGGGAPYAAKLVARRPALARVPVIFCSAMPMDEVKRWFPEHPLRRYHPKPVDFDAMRRQVEELLGAVAGAAGPSEPRTRLAQALEREAAALRGPAGNDVGARVAELLLADALAAGASDVHFDPQRDSVLVRYRVDGMLRDQAAYPKARFPIVPRLRVLSNLPPIPAVNAGAEEGSFEIPGLPREVRARLSSFPCGNGEKIVVRILDGRSGILKLDALGIEGRALERFKEVIQQPAGVLFVSGTTGSGKTTTLTAVLEFLSRSELNIMTLEDPIEYQLPRVNHAQINPRCGFGFAEGLRGVLRQDPNVIMVGEARDAETAELCLRAATTGHKVFSTIHAHGAAGVVPRLLAMGMEPFLVSDALSGALAQRTLRRVCGVCAEPAMIDPELLETVLKAVEPAQRESVRAILSKPGGRFLRGRGCAACYGSGYRGRIGIFELLVVDPAIRAMILEKAPGAEIADQARRGGMRTLLMDAAAKVWSGATSLEEAYRIMRV